jgi:hypothetical protein
MFFHILKSSMVMAPMMMVVTPPAATVPFTRRIPTATSSLGMLFSRHTPKAMASPRALLTFFGAVLCPSTSSTFRELALVLLPLPALPVCALTDAATRVVFSAKVSHYHTRPVLHVVLLR